MTTARRIGSGENALARRRRRAAHVNIDAGERWVSLIGGSLLAVFGLSRGGRAGVLAALGGGALVYRGARGHSQLYEVLGLAGRPTHVAHVARVTSLAHRRGVTVRRTVSINKPVEEVYAFWRDFENLPRFMRHLESVTCDGPQRSHWVARPPGGRRVAWDAEIVDERPNELIAWRSLDDADVRNAGSVTFEPGQGGRGTTIRVSLSYAPPGGKLAAVIAKLFGEEPGQQIHDDLRRLKQLLEAGEVPTVEGQPRGFGGPQRRGSQVLRGHA
jgi:uncharacterized membrane protein